MTKIEVKGRDLCVKRFRPNDKMVHTYCSYCGYSAGVASELTVVRSAVAIPYNALIVYFCNKCKERQQQYLEKKTGHQRGDIVQMKNFGGKKIVEITGMFDEVYFIGHDGYCYAYSHIDKTLGIQKSLF